MAAVADVRVRVDMNRAGDRVAQIFIGNKALKQLPASAFNEEMRQAIEAAAPKQFIVCVAVENPTPDTIKPAPVQPQALAAATPRSATRPPQGQPRITTAAPVSPVSPSELDENPYNFAEWAGDEPWAPVDLEAHEPGAHHDEWRLGDRVSGVMRLRLEARTPLFIPEGTFLPPDDPAPRRFWRCKDASGRIRCAIPGSSVKGAARTLFETWTNSRLTVVSDANYSERVAYRRRSAALWVIESAGPAGLSVLKCQCLFARDLGGGRWDIARAGTLPAGASPVSRSAIDPADRTNWQAISLQANLLWTTDHTHRWTHLLVHVTTQAAAVPGRLVDRYKDYVRHSPALRDHLDRVQDLVLAGLGRNYYKNLSAERAAFGNRLDGLEQLDRGDYIFGILEPTKTGTTSVLACFGKNVNFMWPSACTPKDLAKGFYPRDEKQLTLEEADFAQATFGFAGSYRNQGHPFRSRIRFGTFWVLGEAQPKTDGVIQLDALTSPTGVKLKARSLYLPPGEDGATQTYDEGTRLRGRKFYWHQRTSDGRVHPHHTAREGGGQRPAPIEPLAAGTAFEGEVHFDNLTEMELGALIVSLCPDRLFGTDGKYGWKIGKGKPRGLGSVWPSIVTTRKRIAFDDVFASLASPSLRDMTTNESVQAIAAFTSWLDRHAPAVDAKGWRDLSFVQDLERLLRLPEAPTVRRYPDIKVIGGPPPVFDSATGDAAGGRRSRPRAMKPARGQ